MDDWASHDGEDVEEAAHAAHTPLWLHLLLVSVFMASLLHLPVVQLLITPLEEPTLAGFNLALHLTQPVDTSQPPRLSTVLISRERHELDYSGLRPLPREVLLKDLQALSAGLDPRTRLLALDIDVSPTALSLKSGAEKAAQDQLSRFLEQRADKAIWRLILPFPAWDPALREAKAQWVRTMCEAGLTFTDARLQPTLGIVTSTMAHDGHSLALHLRSAVEDVTPPQALPPGHSGSKSLCKSLLADEALLRALLTPDTLHAQLDSIGADLSREPLTGCARPTGFMAWFKALWKPPRLPAYCPSAEASFAPFHRALSQLTLWRWCQGPRHGPAERDDCQALPDPASDTRPLAKVVVFGGEYDASDRFVTPLGVRAGAEVHAMAATDRPVTKSSLLSFLVDILFGLSFGWVAHRCWQAWFDARSGAGAEIGGMLLQSHSSWIALLLLLVAMLLLTVVGLWVAAEFFSRVAIWVSPVPVLIGMFIDGFVTTSVAVASHGSQPPKDSLVKALRNLGNGVADDAGTLVHLGLYLVPKLIYIGVVAYAIVHIFMH